MGRPRDVLQDTTTSRGGICDVFESSNGMKDHALGFKGHILAKS